MSTPESTLPLDSEIRDTVELYGRTYQDCSVGASIYCVPIDDIEQERLNEEHNVLQLVFDKRLIFPPITNPTKILDCGSGTAAWAADVAELYPNSSVIGVDISPHMTPDETPFNLWLQVDDLNKPFTFQDREFDVVHSRLVTLGIDHGRWEGYIRDCVRVLKPNGWLQMVEYYYNVQSDNGSLTENNALRQWTTRFFDAHVGKKDLRAPLRLERMFRAAGLVDLEARMIPVPLSGWQRAERDREIGERNKDVFKAALGSLSLQPFMENLDMTLAEFQVFMASARQELDSLSYRPYLGLYVCIGRKPS